MEKVEKVVFVAYFHDTVESNVVDLRAFHKREDAEDYILFLGKKWFGKQFSSLTEMELWMLDPNESDGVPGYMDIIESVLN